MTCDWNADRYHEISAPQQDWGRRVLNGIVLAGNERVLDIGCGTGRLTALLSERVPNGRSIGLDRSEAMLGTAREWLRRGPQIVPLVLADGAALPFSRAFDLVFSAASFHWIRDHSALFRSILISLRPGGRLVAQCGGGPNLALLRARVDRLMRDARFAPHFADWSDPWYFADVNSTVPRLSEAGFVDIQVGLEEAPASFTDAREFSDFIATVCVRHHLARLTSDDRVQFLAELTLAAATDDPPFTLDYWRLNISARRPQ